MDADYHRHDISDEVWERIKEQLPGRRGQWGGIAKDNRQFINAVLWILRTDAPWRDLPPDYGDWKNAHRRYSRWRDKGYWEKLLEQFFQEEDFVWLMIDTSHVKVHPDASEADGGNQDMARTKGGSAQRFIWPWMRLVCRSECSSRQVPLRAAHLRSSSLKG